jgi:hypothetical protein
MEWFMEWENEFIYLGLNLKKPPCFRGAFCVLSGAKKRLFLILIHIETTRSDKNRVEP